MQEGCADVAVEGVAGIGRFPLAVARVEGAADACARDECRAVGGDTLAVVDAVRKHAHQTRQKILVVALMIVKKLSFGVIQSFCPTYFKSNGKMIDLRCQNKEPH